MQRADASTAAAGRQNEREKCKTLVDHDFQCAMPPDIHDTDNPEKITQ